jgi:hypothetical protein
MANFNSTTAKVMSYPDSGGYNVHRSLFGDINYTTGNTYLHFKTNVPIATFIMTMIEMIGYNYGASVPIRCAWGFYTYGGSIITAAVRTSAYNGVSANGIYATADGYVAIRAYAASNYYTGFTLNGYQTAGNGRGFDLKILAASYGTNSGSAF